MKKNYLFLAATAILALAACSDNTYLGDNEGGTTLDNMPISFNMSTPTLTRAPYAGSAAADLLNNNFVVYGFKTVGGTPSTVFDNYQVNWVNNTAGTTESNSADWEYVSYKNLPVGVTTNVGVTAFSALTGASEANENAIDQSIKYWDFSASAYDFFAYSLGDGSTSTWAIASALNKTGYGDGGTHPGYTLAGTQAQLGTCYISKQKHMTSLSPSATEVELEFMNFLSKIQLKFYEIIPGYSVKDVKFYIDGSTKSTGDADNDGLKPAIYGAASSIPTGGTYTITFDTNYDPVVTLSSASTSDSKVLFDAVTTGPNVWLSDYATRDYKETEETVYLGRSANAATSTKEMSVLPNSTGATLTLKVDYTLLSRDGSGETIQVTGATATVPAEYTKWKPNYAYTYIFKISDNNDGHIGGVEGLYPITFDAVVTETTNGSQTTVTTVEPISITTYQNGAIANEYAAGNIYVAVEDAGTVALTAGTNAKLYTATVQAGAAQGLDGSGNVAITEEQVANVLTNGTQSPTGTWTVTDANSKNMVVTQITSGDDALTGSLTAIPAADAPGGKELAINCAKFAAANNKVYVFEYLHYYTAAEAATYNAGLTGAIASGATLTAEQAGLVNTALSTSYATDGTAVISETDAKAYNATLTGAVSTSDIKSKHYKVIKVGAPTPL